MHCLESSHFGFCRNCTDLFLGWGDKKLHLVLFSTTLRQKMEHNVVKIKLDSLWNDLVNVLICPFELKIRPHLDGNWFSYWFKQITKLFNRLVRLQIDQPSPGSMVLRIMAKKPSSLTLQIFFLNYCILLFKDYTKVLLNNIYFSQNL